MAEVQRYPLGFLTDQTRLVVERVNNGHVTQTVLLQMAVASVIDKRAGKALKKKLKELGTEA